jgi:hypothetical protein
MIKKPFVLILALLLIGKGLLATHNVGGQISYRPLDTLHVPCLNYELTVITYTDMTSTTDRCSLVVDCGDGHKEILVRINHDPSTDALCNYITSGVGGGVPLNPQVLCGNNLKKNIYRGAHLYSGVGDYFLMMHDPNLSQNICNVVNSLNAPFVLSAQLNINMAPGGNTSPVFNAIPACCACVGTCFNYQPFITLAPGDSLYASLGAVSDTTGNPLSTYSTPPITSGGSLWGNTGTGDFIWCSPPMICSYLFSIKADQWKNFGGQSHYMGFVTQVIRVVVTSPGGLSPCTAGVMPHFDVLEPLLDVFPNPASGDVTFLLKKGTEMQGVLEIFDLSGRCLLKLREPSDDSFVISKGSLPAGAYLYKYSDEKTFLLSSGKFLILP